MGTSCGRERNRREAGVTLIEMLVIVALVGIITMIGSAVWLSAQKRSNCPMAARMVKTFMLQARMLAVYRGIHHFIVFDPATKTLSIFEDSTAPLGVFNTGDRRIAQETLPQAADLTLPAAPSPLSNPLGGGALTDAWSVPLPDTSGAWGTDLRGVRMTPSGQIQSVEASPQIVVGGVMVFSDLEGRTAAVGFRGQTGSVRGFQLLDTSWSEL